MIAFSAVLGILLILGTIGLLARRSNRDGTGRGPPYVGNRSYTTVPDVASPKEEPVPAPRAPRVCPSCGAAIRYSGAEYCQSCGASLGIALQTSSTQAKKVITGFCTICGTRLHDGSDTVRCPYCGGMAHRIHMLEWLHAKDYCPTCRRHLEERDLDKPRCRGVHCVWMAVPQYLRGGEEPHERRYKQVARFNK